jgi:hypothetical protein
LAAEYVPPTVQEQLAEQLRQAQEQKQPEFQPQAQDFAALYDAATKALNKSIPLVSTTKDFIKLVSTRGKVSKNFKAEIQTYTARLKNAADEHYRTNRNKPNGGQFLLTPDQLSESKPKRTLVIVAYLLRRMTDVDDSIFPVALKDAALDASARFRNMFNLEARDLIGAMEELIGAQNETLDLAGAIDRLNN